MCSVEPGAPLEGLLGQNNSHNRTFFFLTFVLTFATVVEKASVKKQDETIGI